MGPRYLTMQEAPQNVMGALAASPINGMMTMLASKYPAIANYRDELGRRVSDLLRDPQGFFRSAANDVFPTMIEAEANLRRNRMAGSIMRDAPDAKDDALQQAYRNKMTNLGMAAITAYHGSPHKFDKFDMSKVGTGEGAQAYGHGLYFAENPVTAKYYQSPLNMKDYSNAESALLHNLAREVGYDPNAIYGLFKQRVNEGLGTKFGTAYSETISKIKSSDDVAKVLNEKPGNFYKVDLPDDQIAKMLDWDKPLSQQKEILDALGINEKGLHQIKLIGGAGDSVQSLMNAIASASKNRNFDASYASQFLNKNGIPGIRYLDQGSRDAGKGTSNFVVFDDNIPKILSRE